MRGPSRFENPKVARMREIADEMQREAKKSKPDDGKIEMLSVELNQVEAELAAERAAQLQRLVDGFDENGKPYKRTRGATTRDLDDDPFGEPRSIERPGLFANPWTVFESDHDLRSASPSEWRGRALSAVERASGANDGTRATLSKSTSNLELQVLRTP